jgi:ER membrane protein complex subunit 2
MNDPSVWALLAEIYLKTHNYQKAIFCWEEVLLSSPLNYQIYLRIAECYYTLGKGDNLILARKYFSRTLELKSDYPRAFWGLLITCKKLKEEG